MSEAWLIVSGKGGTGKTLVTAALGCALSRRGYKVCLIDACFGLRCLDFMLGMQNQVIYDCADVMTGNCELDDALMTVENFPNLTFLSAPQNPDENLFSSGQYAQLIQKLKQHAAYVLVDLPSGIERNTRRWFSSGDRALIISTVDEMTMRCTEQVSSAIRSSGSYCPQMLLCNRLNEHYAAAKVCYTPQVVASVLDLPLLGYLPEDTLISKKLNAHSYLEVPMCSFRSAVDRVCKRMTGEQVSMPSFAKK